MAAPLDVPNVSLAELVQLMQRAKNNQVNKRSEAGALIQKALSQVGMIAAYNQPLWPGVVGPKTLHAYAKWQARKLREKNLPVVLPAVTGVPDRDSLAALAEETQLFKVTE
jgi:hypothetical protein